MNTRFRTSTVHKYVANPINMIFLYLPLLPETTEGFGKGMVLLGSSRDVPGLAPSAIKESGSCCEILAFGPLVPGTDFPLSMAT